MRRILLAIAAILVIGGGAYFFFGHQDNPSVGSSVAPTIEGELAASSADLTQTYINQQYRFGLKMPADFKASQVMNPDGGQTIVLQNSSGDGIQIMISAFDEDNGSGYTLTADRIHQDLPDLAIDDPQTVDIGDSYHGLAFLSDNQSFDGNSREVWFVFRGNLYQISTYARLDDLLKGIFSTWQFQ